MQEVSALRMKSPGLGSSEHLDVRVENTIALLKDGNESQRVAALRAVQRGDIANRAELGRRLREEITGPFGPGGERNYGTAVRDPKFMASVRSWMISALLACEPLHEATSSLLRSEIGESFEADENVRFWTLAGCYTYQVPYLDHLIKTALSDNAAQVRFLARAIVSPADKELLEGFERAIAQESFEAVWPYLRAMRVVSLPALAPVLPRLLDREFSGVSLAYDVLYALAPPAMAKAAKPFLEKSPGLARTIEAMMNAALDAGPAAAANFAHLLRVFDYDEAHSLVSSYVGNARYRDVPRRILRSLQQNAGQAAEGEVPIVGYATDTVDRQLDQLGLAREVSVLTALMLSKEAIPPLAIGLFGNWGSGKSFFMRSMHKTAKALARRSKATQSKRFCANIVQIEFNAWHYTDSSLWASLATYILEGLNGHFKPAESMAAQQLVAEQEVAKARQVAESAEIAHRELARALAQEESTQVELQAARLAGTMPLSSFSVADVATLIDSNPELRKTVDAALDSLGMPKTRESVSELAATLQDVQGMAGKVTSLIESLCRRRTLGVFIALLLVAVFGIPPLFDYLRKSGVFDHAMAASSAVISQIGIAATALVTWISQGAGLFRTSIDKVSKARREIERMLKDKQSIPTEEEKLLAAKIAKLKLEEGRLTQELERAQRILAASEHNISQLTPTALLRQFLSDRLQGDDYRKHLGLVATVRDDFERLSRLISSQSLHDSDARPIERIVLYIDDLDRCPAPKVVEVLQAVHLLLAYPLFVVVVGVDSRWLIHSLTTHYRQLGGDGDNIVDPDWTATPQHYLEKIFQISYALRPMDSEGYENLIGQFMQDNEAPPLGSSKTSGVDRALDGKPESPGHGASRKELPDIPASGLSGGTPPPNESVGEAVDEGETAGTTDIASLIEEAAMTIHPLEVEFAKELHAFIQSPRAAKRLTNIYRILKAGVPKHDLHEFEGDDAVPGQFQVPMLLLAILLDDPNSAEVFFVALLAAPNGFYDLRPTLGNDRGDRIDKIMDIVSRGNFPNEGALIRFWIPKVARFSFGMAQLAGRNRGV